MSATCVMSLRAYVSDSFNDVKIPVGNWGVWQEAENLMGTNIPTTPSDNGPMPDDSCSGYNYMQFVPRRYSPHDAFNPPGYFFVRYFLYFEEAGEYGNFWIATDLVKDLNLYSWVLNGSRPMPLRFVQTAPHPMQGLDWHKVDTSEANMDLPAESSVTLEIRARDPSSDPYNAPFLGNFRLDVFVFTSDMGWTPDGFALPELPVADLDRYEDLVIFNKGYLEHVLPDTLPMEDEVADRLWTFAAPGEYEPVSFCIYARRELKEVDIEVVQDPFAERAIRPEWVDIGSVRVVEKINLLQNQNTETSPELLDPIRPLVIPQNSTKQIWMILKAPEDSEPGNYSAIIQISERGTSIRNLSLELEILPFRLIEDPNKVPGIVYHGADVERDPRGMNEWELMEEDLNDIVNHGAKVVTYSIFPEMTIHGDKVTYNYTRFSTGLKMIQDFGLGDLPVSFGQLGKIHSLLSKSLGPDRADGELIRLVKEIEELIVRKDLPKLIYLVIDEPHGEQGVKMSEFIRLSELLREETNITLLSTTTSWAYCQYVDRSPYPPLDVLDRIVDIRYFNGWSLDSLLNNHMWGQIRDEAELSGDEIFTYYNTHNMPGRPEFSRVTMGLWFWLNPMLRSCPWRYRMPAVGDPELSILGYTYPPETPDGLPIPTLRWEGFREGIDDLRYLYTLEATIDNASGTGYQSPALDEARSFLDSLRRDFEFYGMTARSISSRLTTKDYQEIRLRAARLVMNIPDAPLFPFSMLVTIIISLLFGRSDHDFGLTTSPFSYYMGLKM